MKKTEIKGLIIGCVVLVALMAVFAVIYTKFVQKPATGEKAITVEIVFADESTKTAEIQTDAEYLRQALEEENLIEGKESASGLYVLTVDGVTADESIQQWWCFTKDGEELYTGVDSTPIEDGDHFEITLKTGY